MLTFKNFKCHITDITIFYYLILKQFNIIQTLMRDTYKLFPYYPSLLFFKLIAFYFFSFNYQ